MYKIAKTKYGEKYNTGTKRNSGSAETSLGNTFVTALFCYIVLRECGMSPDDAFSALGIFGGDDGVSWFPSSKIAQEVADICELKLKLIRRDPGQSVGFLGRFWVDPWASNRSFIHPARVLSKFHFAPTNDPNVKPDVLAWRKAVSLFATDSTTPIVGDLARRILTEVNSGSLISGGWQPFEIGLPSDIDTTSKAVLSKFGNDPVYPGPLPSEHHFVVKHLIEELQISEEDFLDWQCVFENAQDYRTLPLLYTYEPTVPKTAPVTVDGQLLGPAMSSSPSSSPAPEVKTLCKFFLRSSGCSKSDSDCKFSHTKTYCRDFISPRGCKREKCKFPHYARS
jgi:hypothetical protein